MICRKNKKKEEAKQEKVRKEKSYLNIGLGRNSEFNYICSLTLLFK